jgi:hypothetical protein
MRALGTNRGESYAEPPVGESVKSRIEGKVFVLTRGYDLWLAAINELVPAAERSPPLPYDR